MRVLVIIAILVSSLSTDAQEIRFMEWNIENMFYPTDDPLTADEDFTPTGSHRWTFSRFAEKANRISQVIAAAGTPPLIALCEVEDDSTMIWLTERSVMRTLGYKWIRTHGADRRGINVALLYDPFIFRPISINETKIQGQHKGFRPTRNILYVTGETKGRNTLDTLHIIVCHLPSQAGGTRASEKSRQLASDVLRRLTDSISDANHKSRIIVAGDFNSDSRSRLIRELVSDRLQHLPFDFPGTYRYQGIWSHLDHIFCSPTIHADTVHVIHTPWLLESNATYGGSQPKRTFRGPSYHGGVSDHLPIVVTLEKRGKWEVGSEE